MPEQKRNWKHPKHECYICGRNERDLKALSEKWTTLLNDEYISELEKLEYELQEERKKHKEKYQKLLDDTKETVLNFNIVSVLKDEEAFSKTIPHLKGFLEFYEKVDKSGYGGRLVSSPMTLAALRQRIQDEDYSPLSEIKEQINKAKGSEQQVQNRYGFVLKEVSMSFRGLLTIPYVGIAQSKTREEIRLKTLGDNNYSVYICTICNWLFKTASNAAHRVIEEKYNDD